MWVGGRGGGVGVTVGGSVMLLCPVVPLNWINRCTQVIDIFLASIIICSIVARFFIIYFLSEVVSSLFSRKFYCDFSEFLYFMKADHLVGKPSSCAFRITIACRYQIFPSRARHFNVIFCTLCLYMKIELNSRNIVRDLCKTWQTTTLKIFVFRITSSSSTITTHCFYLPHRYSCFFFYVRCKNDFLVVST